MLSLWQMGLSASAVILLAALLRRLTGSRLPRRMYVALWDVAMLSSLIPFRVTWSALIRSAEIIRETASSAAMQPMPLNVLPVEAAPAAVLPGAALPAARSLQAGLTQTAETVREAVQTAPDWLWRLASVLWGIGALILAAMLLYRWLSCRHAFAEALPCDDPRAIAFLRDHPLRRRVQIRVSDRIRSPLSYGLLRPVILLPASLADTDDQTLGYVLTHEHMHIRAWDMLRKSALLLTLCLHWPNPLFWLMVRLCNRDMELMCDERVVRSLGGRKAYCLTLLDMEVQRSNLTMGTCFSVTGIEERINVMKNRKHQGILSIALAFAILLGATAGAMTGIPMAGAESPSPRIFFSRSSWENSYAQYEPYGLGYDETNGTITYNGHVVRYFEDMWPIDEQGKAGTCFMYEAGEVDVYAVREFPEIIQRNPDGSFDPSGILKGLREATPEEYAELTARHDQWASGSITECLDAYQLTDSVVATKLQNVEWWTAEEFREWLEQERIALQELVRDEARSWTPSTGWFTWTQEKADEAIARYEALLLEIEQGAFVSKAIDGQDASMVLAQGTGVADVVPIERVSDATVVEDSAITYVFSGYDDPGTIRYGLEPDLGSDSEGIVYLISVGPEDEWRYTPEAWARIQELIDLGVVQWEEPAAAVQALEAQEMEAALISQYQTDRINGWRDTIAPYARFGLSFALDTAMDLVHLYWNGQEVRGVFDPYLGTWITEHTGTGFYSDGAKELIAVYENGVLTGLREADAEESAVWDNLRKENMQ